MKVDWVDDWPVFNEGENISLLTRGRDLQPQTSLSPGESTTVWKADLSIADLELGWYQKRELKNHGNTSSF